MPKPVIVIHFQPIELYPPLINLLNYIHEQHGSQNVIVLTSSTGSVVDLFTLNGSNIKIKRLARFNKKQSGFNRYLNYFLFYSLSLLQLITKRPAAILYFETLSSFPVWAYKKYFATQVPVFIHYHEYTSPEEYATGMMLGRIFHVREKWLYEKAAWISHTNDERLKLFLQDENLKGNDSKHVLPNYPPEKWKSKKEWQRQLPVRVVYVGALSLDTMYLEVFCKWILRNNGKVSLDIYSNNIEETAQRYIQALNGDSIRLHNGVSYHQLPAILQQYDVGVILYNGHIPNYVYNAPNKLFEYMACGLDVWFPSVMQGCLPYTTTNSFPKVVPFDFSNADNFVPEMAIDANGYIFKGLSFYSENVLPVLTKALFKYS